MGRNFRRGSGTGRVAEMVDPHTPREKVKGEYRIIVDHLRAKVKLLDPDIIGQLRVLLD